MKYPIGIQSFEQVITGGYLYFDKTALIYDMVKSGKVYFLSRPRRFGKSMLISTLECYFSGRRELFKGLAIDKLEKDWEAYPVMHISFGGQNFAERGALEKVIEELLCTWEAEYGRGEYATTMGSRFNAVIRNAFAHTGHRVVVLVDEYDKPLLDVMDIHDAQQGDDSATLEEHNRNILKAFYSVFKEADASLQFVLLTGVTKFAQVSVFSGFNQPDDISLSARYDTLCGITEKELHSVMAEQIVEMARAYDTTVDDIKERLRKQYDGYHFSRRMEGVYNPFSILCAFREMMMDNYWFKTGSPTFLVRLLAHSNENINELVGKYYPTSEFDEYKATTDTPLPMIYQSGYLTIKDYNRLTNAYLLDYPNEEVKRGFVSILASSYLKPEENTGAWTVQMVGALEKGDVNKVRVLLTSFLASIPYSMRRKDNEREKERYFQYTFYLIMRMISTYLVFAEKEQSEGRVDCVVETRNDVYIFEFKKDGSAHEAVEQIDRKGYAREYAADKRRVHKIGCSFSSKTGTVDDWQEA